MMMDDKEDVLIHHILESARRSADRVALVVNGDSTTYRSLTGYAARIAATIKQNETKSERLAAVLAYRSKTAYAGILAVLMSGKGYVPLNPKFPVERSYRMLDLSKCNILVVGNESIDHLKMLLGKVKGNATVILPDSKNSDRLPELYPHIRFIFSKDICAQEYYPELCGVHSNDIAYLLFTSGSTGVPKGVPVSNRNVTSYIKYITKRYSVTENDRVSQTFDMTFDLSVHDMFVCWTSGASLYCLPDNSLMAPAKFIRENQLSLWFSVPSVAMFMTKMRMLKPDSFPSLRCSLFCGEPLPASMAEKWQAAAPNSFVENLYGPTEATIAIAHYRWEKGRSEDLCINGIVPIGNIFHGQSCCIIDKDKNDVGRLREGELCLCGSQVTKGYLNDPEKTKAQFITIRGKSKNDIWYRTGDRATIDQEGIIYYLGRMDNQVKIHGYRIELQEIDAALREASGQAMSVAVAWPVKDGCAQGIVGFICKEEGANESEIIAQCKDTLPEYAVPRKIHFLGSLPLNVNGKVDRKKLVDMLESGLV